MQAVLPEFLHFGEICLNSLIIANNKVLTFLIKISRLPDLLFELLNLAVQVP